MLFIVTILGNIYIFASSRNFHLKKLCRNIFWEVGVLPDDCGNTEYKFHCNLNINRK